MRYLMPWRALLALILTFAVPSLSRAQAPAETPAAKGDPRLAEAVSRRDTPGVRALLAQKVDVNAPDVQGTPALHWAVRLDDIDLVRLLLSSGADAKLTNRYGVTPLTLAVTNGNPAIMRLLLDAGGDANALDPSACCWSAALLWTPATRRTSRLRS
jgi:ankyrin repeat protein